jgi:hypothetical protein
MADRLPKLVATSVVRGSQQGESHGGIFTIDFETREVQQQVDWNTGEIDFEGRGADRGLRGIEFGDDFIYVAASDELFRTIFLTSTGYDSLLAFDIDQRNYVWGIQIQRILNGWQGAVFDPRTGIGPTPSNNFHINMVHVDDSGIYVSGLRTGAMLHINSQFEVNDVCNIPMGAHNAQPYRDGVLVNDTQSDMVRYSGRDGASKAFKVISYDEKDIEFAGIDDSKVARQGFGRGLVAIDDRLVAGGSSPSTVTLYDIESEKTLGSVNLTMDIRNAIHGLEVWPYN